MPSDGPPSSRVLGGEEAHLGRLAQAVSTDAQEPHASPADLGAHELELAPGGEGVVVGAVALLLVPLLGEDLVAHGHLEGEVGLLVLGTTDHVTAA